MHWPGLRYSSTFCHRCRLTESVAVLDKFVPAQCCSCMAGSSVLTPLLDTEICLAHRLLIRSFSVVITTLTLAAKNSANHARTNKQHQNNPNSRVVGGGVLLAFKRCATLPCHNRHSTRIRPLSGRSRPDVVAARAFGLAAAAGLIAHAAGRGPA